MAQTVMKKRFINPISFFIGIFFILFGYYINAASVKLAWDVSCETNVVKYVFFYTTNILTTPETEVEIGATNECGVYYPTTTNIFYGHYTNSIDIIGRTNTMCIISNLIAGSKYYFTIKCVNNYGLESFRAGELSYIVPNTTNVLPTKVGGLTIISFEE
jgi:hypothetical protein